MLPYESLVSTPSTDQTHWLQRSFCLQVNAACLSRERSNGEPSNTPPKRDLLSLPFSFEPVLSLLWPSQTNHIASPLTAVRRDSGQVRCLGGVGQNRSEYHESPPHTFPWELSSFLKLLA